MTCKHNNSIPIFNYIVAKTTENLPAGLIFMSIPRRESDDIMLLDGRYLSCDDFPELYSVIGDNFCPKTVKTSKFFGPLEDFLVSIGVPLHKIQKDAPNPSYKEGFFRIPNMHFNRRGA